MNWRKIFAVIWIVAALAGGYWVWRWLNPPPELVIRRQLEKLAEGLSARAQGNIARASAVSKAMSVFASDVVINTEGMPRVGESISGRTELQQALFAAKQQLEGDVTFVELHVTVGAEGTNALARFSAVAKLSGQADPYSLDVKAQFQKIEGDWLISRVDPVNSVLPPPQ